MTISSAAIPFWIGVQQPVFFGSQSSASAGLPPVERSPQPHLERSGRLPSKRRPSPIDAKHGFRHVDGPARLPEDLYFASRHPFDQCNDLQQTSAMPTPNIENAHVTLIDHGLFQREHDVLDEN